MNIEARAARTRYRGRLVSPLSPVPHIGFKLPELVDVSHVHNRIETNVVKLALLLVGELNLVGLANIHVADMLLVLR